MIEVANIATESQVLDKSHFGDVFLKSPLGQTLDESIFKDHLQEFLAGAHIVLTDGGEFFEKVFEHSKNTAHLSRRYSLHYSPFEPQYSFSIKKFNVREVLIGKSVLSSGEVISWIQAEKHSCRSFAQQYWHTIDALIYVMAFRSYNIGPFGLSTYTSSKPLVLGE